MTADLARRPTSRATPGKFGLQPMRAFQAMRRLIADKEDTQQVFEIMRALSGKTIPKGYRRLLSTPGGGYIAYQREEFADRLSDPAWLASFGPGTVGAAYRDFIAPRGLSAEGLADESRKVPDNDVDAAHPYAWFGRRVRDVHDVWHVLTGYSTDGFGEVCVVAFSYGQTDNLGFGFISAAGAREYIKLGLGHPFGRAAWQAYQNGRRAAWLAGEDYHALFAENLDSARRRLNIPSPDLYLAIPAEDRDRLGKTDVAH
ncbi:Coq4 family protein [Caulobacter sp. 73W]|uniref:Coq4 family protein n=1 Tax=Caulobacter sp. 73W TaxID=3161137 RepID=A0AB39KT17_9CAUL